MDSNKCCLAQQICKIKKMHGDDIWEPMLRYARYIFSVFHGPHNALKIQIRALPFPCNASDMEQSQWRTMTNQCYITVISTEMLQQYSYPQKDVLLFVHRCFMASKAGGGGNCCDPHLQCIPCSQTTCFFCYHLERDHENIFSILMIATGFF